MIDLRQKKAFALPFSLLFIFLIISFMAVYMQAVANGLSQATRIANQNKAYYVAEAGLVDAYERVTHAGNTIFTSSTCVNPNSPSTCSNPLIPSGSTDPGTYSVGNSIGNYTVSIVYSSKKPLLNYIITSTGTYNNTSKTLQLTINGKPISFYAYLSNTEINPNVGAQSWNTGNLLNGPVHTNGTFNIDGNPVFEGPVSEGGNSPDYWTGIGSKPNFIFPNGITNNAPPIIMPTQTMLNNLHSIASDGQGLVLTGPSTIIFNPGGTTISVTGVVKNAKGIVTTSYNNTSISDPSNGVIYVQSNCVITNNCIGKITGPQDGNVTVQGTVSGQLTVAADQNIYISGNVQYNAPPVRPGIPGGDPNSTDLLSLVAFSNITINSASAPASLEVDAVLVALNGAFQADNPLVPGKGNMDQFGSLINDYNGPTGFSTSIGVLIGGWNELQNYDPRLANTAPPGFPTLVDGNGIGSYSKLSIQECINNTCG